MALTIANTAVATNVTATNTTPTGVSVVDGYSKTLGVSIVQVGTASTVATWWAQVSFDGGSTYLDHAGTSQAGIAAGTAANTYSWTVVLPSEATHVRVPFTAQAGGTSSTLNAVVGKVTAL